MSQDFVRLAPRVDVIITDYPSRYFQEQAGRFLKKTAQRLLAL